MMGLLKLDDRFIRLHIVPLTRQDGCDFPINGRRDLTLHLHRFDDQQGITGMDLIADGGEDLHDAAGHRWGNVPRF